MSFDEKNWWVYAALAVIVPAIYFATVLGQIQATPVTEIEYQRPMLTAIGAAIGLSIVASIAIAVASPRGVAKTDQRDRDINRLGEHVGGLFLGVAMVPPFALAMLEFDHFWIANAMYLAFTLAALVGSVVKLVVYRRGF
jgi:drug/metabolite transporter (DMT)-like permease